MNTHPIIFLDVDGVLNCQLYYEEQQKKKTPKFNSELLTKKDELLFYKHTQICKKRIGWFNDLCKTIDAVVVVSSTWRHGRTVEELQEIFDFCGGQFQIIGKTPNTRCERGTEISKWLHDNITLEEYGCQYYDFHRYAIIDDDSDMLLNQRFNFFQTDNYSGLTPTTCYKIIRFITGKTFGKNE